MWSMSKCVANIDVLWRLRLYDLSIALNDALNRSAHISEYVVVANGKTYPIPINSNLKLHRCETNSRVSGK